MIERFRILFRHPRNASVAGCFLAVATVLVVTLGIALSSAAPSPPPDPAHRSAVDLFRPEAVPELPARCSPWGRFQPGSWRRQQTTTWTRRDGARIPNVTESKITLRSIETDGLTLEEVSTVDMGGKRVETAPVGTRFDFFQQPIRENTILRADASRNLTVSNRIVPCQTRIYECTTPSGKHRTTVWFSPHIYPYVLRVERVLRSRSTDERPEETTLSRSTTEVVETSAFQIRKNKRGTYRLRTIRNAGGITTITDSFCSRHIPGGVDRETIRELDETGREIRTVETRLINYRSIASSPSATLPQRMLPPRRTDENPMPAESP